MKDLKKRLMGIGIMAISFYGLHQSIILGVNSLFRNSTIDPNIILILFLVSFAGFIAGAMFLVANYEAFRRFEIVSEYWSKGEHEVLN